MSEPRQRARPKGPQFPSQELSALLSAYGDALPTSTNPSNTPLPETIRVLDEIITDFILETCHIASIPAELSHRSKIKLDDFKFALRKDERKLGRMMELLGLQKRLTQQRRAFDTEEGEVARREAGLLEGEGGKVPGRGRGRRKKKREEDEEEDGGVRRGKSVGGDGESGRGMKRMKIEEGSSEVE